MIFYFFVFLFSLAFAQPAQDRVKSLPLYDGFIGNQYSGYITVDKNHGRKLHYWFVESFGNPSTDPVVVWMNGGPGCSSMDGFFYEHGPIHFKKEATVKPYFNPNTWANVSSMLYIEAPAGVGFSYSDTVSDYSTNDTRTASDNYKMLQQFTNLFPNFANHDLWISGESYAGIYVPTLAELVMDGVDNKEFSMNFRGVLVGNGVIGQSTQLSVVDQTQFFFGHALCSKSQWSKVTKYCTSDPRGAQCRSALSPVYERTNGLNPYYIYGDCFSQRPNPSHLESVFMDQSTSVEGVPCVDSTHGNTYLNMPSVKSAIHVNPALSWSICSQKINYTPDYGSVLKIYTKLLSKGYKALIYSGDADTVVGYPGTEWWTSSIGLTPTSVDWNSWHWDDSNGQQVGGFVTEYKEGLTFITILNSGHMVPQYKPHQAFVFFERWIKGEPMDQ